MISQNLQLELLSHQQVFYFLVIICETEQNVLDVFLALRCLMKERPGSVLSGKYIGITVAVVILVFCK